MTLILGIATTLCIGLMIGVELAVSAFINPVLGQLDPRARLAAIRLFAAKLGCAMPFWYVLSFLLLLAEAFFFRRAPQLPLLGAAAAIWAAVIVLTLVFLVPINNRMARLSPDAPVHETLQDHQRWDSLHRIRVVALATAMVLVLAALQI